MSIHGAKMIRNDSLKRWIRTLSVENISHVNIGGQDIELTEDTKRILKSQLKCFADSVEILNAEDDWRIFRGILSTMFYNAFFRVGNNAIHVANYYECLITPSNIKTYKK